MDVEQGPERQGHNDDHKYPAIPALDVRQLSDEQLTKATAEFEAVKDRRYLPFDQLDKDAARADLDRRLLVTVLGLPESLCEPNGAMERLRRKLSVEPRIGGKTNELVFTDDGEESVPRSRGLCGYPGRSSPSAPTPN